MIIPTPQTLEQLNPLVALYSEGELAMRVTLRRMPTAELLSGAEIKAAREGYYRVFPGEYKLVDPDNGGRLENPNDITDIAITALIFLTAAIGSGTVLSIAVIYYGW